MTVTKVSSHPVQRAPSACARRADGFESARGEDCSRFLLIASLIITGVASAFGQTAPANPERIPVTINGVAIPTRSQGTGGRCLSQGPLLRVPSKSGGAEGIVVRVSPPAHPRYAEGAPIAVQMVSTGVDTSLACFNEAGVIDVSFLCPGAQSKIQPSLKSGGVLSPNPLACAEAMADVLAFATGHLRSVDGNDIQTYVGGMTALTDNAGVVGWSMGGVIAVEAMSKYGDRFPNLKWYASWESPFSMEFLDEGSAGQANPFYNRKTGTIDFSTLRYEPALPVHYFPLALAGLPPEAKGLRGALVLDGGPSGPQATYPLQAEYHPGPNPKVYYSARVAKEASNRRVFGANWPGHIATPAEAEEFEKDRAARLTTPIKLAVGKFPSLAVLAFASEENHTADDITYSAARAQVNGFLDAGARWVRLNPDIHYLEWAMAKKSSKPVQNPAGKRYDARSVRDAVEPEDRDGGPTDKAAMIAAVSELADRTRKRNWSAVLDTVLIQAAPPKLGTQQ